MVEGIYIESDGVIIKLAAVFLILRLVKFRLFRQMESVSPHS